MHSTLRIVTVAFFMNTVLSLCAFAGQIYIPVGEARIKRSVVAFPDTAHLGAGTDSGDSRGALRTIRDTMTADLEFTALVTFQSPAAFIEKEGAGLTMETFKMSDWQTIGSEFLIKTGVSMVGDNVSFELRLYDVLGARQILGKRYIVRATEPRILGHTAANDIVHALTGRPGLFFSKIAMVCDKTGTKEIWVTDFDGSNPTQVTHHGTLAFSPAWSADNKRIAYSLFTKNARNIKNIDLYEYEFRTGNARLLSNRMGINSGAAYAPDGRSIALTMSFLGNPELFLLNPLSREVTRLTKSFGFDVDPAFSPDGKKVAFVSSRSNQPMVYVAEVEGLKHNPGQATRVTFAGKFNATPSWAPAGGKMVFAGYNDNHFDVFLMNQDGTNLERLTKNEGNNEDPHFSGDGSMIAFSSSRAGQKNIYVITVDGMTTHRITHGLGNCTTPKWSWPATEPIYVR